MEDQKNEDELGGEKIGGHRSSFCTTRRTFHILGLLGTTQDNGRCRSGHSHYHESQRKLGSKRRNGADHTRQTVASTTTTNWAIGNENVPTVHNRAITPQTRRQGKISISGHQPIQTN